MLVIKMFDTSQQTQGKHFDKEELADLLLPHTLAWSKNTTLLHCTLNMILARPGSSRDLLSEPVDMTCHGFQENLQSYYIQPVYKL